MSIFDNLMQRMGYIKTEQLKDIPRHLLANAAVAKYSLPDSSRYENQADLYRRLSWVHIAVSVKAQSCAVTPFNVKRLVGEEEEDIPNHPFEELLRRPNPLMSRFEFIEATAAYKSLTGNAYWWLNSPVPGSPPAEIWIIPPHKIDPVPDEKMYLSGYMYHADNGQDFPIPLHQIVHFKGFNPLSEFIGLSPVESIATVAIGDMAMQKWNTQAFGENNARLPGILAFADPFNPSDWQQMQEEVDRAAKLRNIMMLQNVSPDGVKWIQASLSQKEMEFLAGREFNKEEIYGIFAPGLASMLDVNATEANANTGKATFTEYALWPMIVSMAEKITNDLLPSYGENLTGEFDDIRVTDRAMELSEQEAAAKVMKIDELREKFYELDKLGDERGDLLVAQIGASPILSEEEKERLEANTQAMQENMQGNDDGAIPAPEIFQPRQPDEEPRERAEGENKKAEIQGELGTWQRWATGRVKQDKPLVGFNTEFIPLAMKAEVLSMLTDAKTPADVTAIFEAVKSDNAADYGGFADLVGALSEATRVLREKGTEDD